MINAVHKNALSENGTDLVETRVMKKTQYSNVQCKKHKSHDHRGGINF